MKKMRHELSIKIKQQILFVSCLVSALILCSRDLFLPSLPAIAASLSVDRSFIMSAVLAGLISDGLAQLIFGSLADNIGRRKILLMGSIICLIGNVLSYFTLTAYMFWISRFITGLGTGCFPVITRILCRDIFADEALTKSLSYLAMASACSPAFAPILGGIMGRYVGWREVFLFLAFLTFICGLIIYIYLPQINLHRYQNHIKLSRLLKAYKILLSVRRMRADLILSAIVFSLSMSFFMLSPFIFQNILKINPLLNGILCGCVTAGFFFGNYSTSLLVGRVKEEWVICVGILLSLLSSLLLMVFHLLQFFSAVSLTCGATLCVFGSGMISPIINKHVLNNISFQIGSAAALLGMARMLGAIIMMIFIALFHIENQLQIAGLFGLYVFIFLYIYKVKLSY